MTKKKAALLIDWESLWIKLRPYRLSVSDLGEKLISLARKMAETENATLDHLSAVSPSNTWGPTGAENALIELGIKPRTARQGKNAADLVIAMHCERLRIDEGFNTFILISGDADFLTIQQELLPEKSLILSGHSADEMPRVLAQGKVLSLPDKLGLKKPETQETLPGLRFLLGVVLAIDERSYLSNYRKSIETIAEFAHMTSEDVRIEWDNAKSARWITEIEQRGGPSIRRPNFDHQLVRESFQVWDEMLNETSRRGFNNSICGADELINVAPIEDVGRADELLDTLIQLGLLTSIEGNLRLANPLYRHGLIWATLRMAAIVENALQSVDRDDGWVEDIHPIRAWRGAYRLGRRRQERSLDRNEMREAQIETFTILRRAKHLGLLSRRQEKRDNGRDTGLSRLAPDGPLRAQYDLAKSTFLKSLDDLGGKDVPTKDLTTALTALGDWTAPRVIAWTHTLAGTGQLRRSNDMITLKSNGKDEGA